MHTEAIHPAVRIGHVHLRVADLDRSIAFYRDALGLGVTADGDWHAFTDKLPLRLPYELAAAVVKRSFVLAVGAQGKAAAAAAIDAPAGDKVPFLLSHYDYGRWLELKSRRATTMEADMQRSLARVFGDADMVIDVDKTGLTFEFAYELK